MSSALAGNSDQRPIYIRSDIHKDRRLCKDRLYIISGQVHVKAGVTLDVEDGARLGILNGRVPGRRLERAALVFDAGSQLMSRRWTLFGCGRGGRAETHPDNGGVWFFGTHLGASKDGMKRLTKPRSVPSSFHARALSARYLGRMDARPSTRQFHHDTRKRLDDLDAVSLMGVGLTEWQIEALDILGAGDDALDLHNSEIQLRKLVIRNPAEDALNISSSRIDITEALRVRMTRRGERDGVDADRDVFDLEVDEGPSRVVLHRGARVDISGVFGDEMQLDSADLPAQSDAGRDLYLFNGRNRRKTTVIESLTED